MDANCNYGSLEGFTAKIGTKKVSLREDGKLQYWSDYGNNCHAKSTIAPADCHNEIVSTLKGCTLSGYAPAISVFKKFTEE